MNELEKVGTVKDGEAEDALFTSPELEVAVKTTKGKTKKNLPAPAPTTPEGDKASDIIGAWIDWYATVGPGVPIPHTVIQRLAKQVKGLIMSGFHSSDIKWGLIVWTIEKDTNPRLSPVEVDNFAWQWANASRGKRGWRQNIQDRLITYSQGAYVPAKQTRQQRAAQTDEALKNWVMKEGS